VSHVNGMPDDCSFVQAGPNTADQLPPSGGLMGTLTLINVANGQDFTVNAIALADLAAAAMYRDSPDPYPDFDAAEVRPESRVFLNGLLYGLRWTGGRDAVSSVLMSTQVLNEFVRDSGTSSQADWVVTLPTLRLYATGEAPFRIRPDSWNLNLDVFDREERAFTTGDCFFGGAGCFRSFFSFYAASVVPIDEGSWEPNEAPPTGVLGSHNVLSIIEPSSPLLQSGWARLSLNPLFDWSMESEPGSTSYDPATGAIRSGRFQVGGLPVTGLMVRTFKNGTLHCGSAACQGNYGGSFSHRYVRSITELP
jgi:hypothetical protein